MLSVDFTHVLKSHIQAGGLASVDSALTSRTRFLQLSAGESNRPDLQIAVHVLSDVRCRGSRKDISQVDDIGVARDFLSIAPGT